LRKHYFKFLKFICYILAEISTQTLAIAHKVIKKRKKKKKKKKKKRKEKRKEISKVGNLTMVIEKRRCHVLQNPLPSLNVKF
jgi:hypothetical protein